MASRNPGERDPRRRPRRGRHQGASRWAANHKSPARPRKDSIRPRSPTRAARSTRSRPERSKRSRPERSTSSRSHARTKASHATRPNASPTASRATRPCSCAPRSRKSSASPPTSGDAALGDALVVGLTYMGAAVIPLWPHSVLPLMAPAPITNILCTLIALFAPGGSKGPDRPPGVAARRPPSDANRLRQRSGRLRDRSPRDRAHRPTPERSTSSGFAAVALMLRRRPPSRSRLRRG